MKNVSSDMGILVRHTINIKDEELKVSEKEIGKENSHVTNLKSKLKMKDEKIVLNKKELKEKEEIGEPKCRECGKTFETNGDLRHHDEMDHNIIVLRLRNIAQHFIKEKAKHKQICEFSSKCPHEHACYYFTEKAFEYVEKTRIMKMKITLPAMNIQKKMNKIKI